MIDWLTALTPTEWSLIGAAFVALTAALSGLWFALAPGPRRRRELHRIQGLLKVGQWQAAIESLARVRGGADEAFGKQCDAVQADALTLAETEALAARDYDAALHYGLHAAKLLDRTSLETRARVQNALLDDVRQRVAAPSESDAATALALIAKVNQIQSPSREGAFWEAIVRLRQGAVDDAVACLQRSRTGLDRPATDVTEERTGASAAPPSTILEPSLYLGGILLRQGQAKDSLRFFTEANRLDSSCPVVGVLLGAALAEAGSDPGMAARTLQKAIKALGAWQAKPAAFWAEVYPEPRSYVRKMSKPFVCPLWGDGPAGLIRLGQLGLAQTHLKQGQANEAAALYDAALKDGAPTASALRGRGVALARLRRFEEAYAPLRQAYDAESPKERWTTGYLALCVAKAKPASADERTRNLAWAVAAIVAYTAPGDREWVALVQDVFAEARAAGVTLGFDEQVYLCEHLASVKAADVGAAAAYAQIQREHPDGFRDEYAWLAASALANANRDAGDTLPLFEAALRDRSAAQAFYAAHGLDFDAIRRAYLTRYAQAHPGQMPTSLGPDPRAEASALLVSESRKREQSGDAQGAVDVVRAFVRLAPDDAAAQDRLACLLGRQGRIDEAIASLRDWAQRAPNDPLPRLRLALALERTGAIVEPLMLARQALDVAQGPMRARVAEVGARLALTRWATRTDTPSEKLLEAAEEFFAEVPGPHGAARRAAVRFVRQGPAGAASLAGTARDLGPAAGIDGYFLSVAAAVAGDWASAASQSRDAAEGPRSPLALAASTLRGVAQLATGDAAGAVASFEKSASGPDDAPETHVARARLGGALIALGRSEAAAAWWQRVPAGKRAEWKIAESLGAVQLLGALETAAQGNFAAAAEKVRLAGKLGSRDRRLAGLLTSTLFRAGRALALANPPLPPKDPGWDEAARFLEQATKAGLSDRPAILLFVSVLRRLGRHAEARQALAKIAAPDAAVFAERAGLAFRDREYAQAADDYRKAYDTDPTYAHAYNRFLAHLWAGAADSAREALADAQTRAPDQDRKLRLGFLLDLLSANSGDAAVVPRLAAISDAEELALLEALVEVGRFESAYPLLAKLVTIRTQSPTAFRAFFGAVLVQAKQFLERNQWEETKILLSPLRRRIDQYRSVLDPFMTVAIYQLLGVATAMLQDFEQALAWFRLAANHAGPEVGNPASANRIHDSRGVPQTALGEQNLALVHEFLNRSDQAKIHWFRFVDALESQARVPEPSTELAFECLGRLAEQAQRAERLTEALEISQRAHRLRPADYDTLERLFTLNSQLRRPEAARKVLDRMREVRPNDPRAEMFELDVREVTSAEEIETLLHELRRVAQKYPGDPRVDDRIRATVANAIGSVERFSDQYAAQMQKVVDQMRRLPSYQVNWPVVRDVMRDLEGKFAALRRVIQRVQSFPLTDDQRRDLTKLVSLCDRKSDQCATLAR